MIPEAKIIWTGLATTGLIGVGNRNRSSIWCTNIRCSQKSFIKRAIVFLPHSRFCFCRSYRIVRINDGIFIIIRSLTTLSDEVFIIYVIMRLLLGYFVYSKNHKKKITAPYMPS